MSELRVGRGRVQGWAWVGVGEEQRGELAKEGAWARLAMPAAGALRMSGRMTGRWRRTNTTWGGKGGVEGKKGRQSGGGGGGRRG